MVPPIRSDASDRSAERREEQRRASVDRDAMDRKLRFLAQLKQTPLRSADAAARLSERDEADASAATPLCDESQTPEILASFLADARSEAAVAPQMSRKPPALHADESATAVESPAGDEPPSPTTRAVGHAGLTEAARGDSSRTKSPTSGAAGNDGSTELAAAAALSVERESRTGDRDSQADTGSKSSEDGTDGVPAYLLQAAERPAAQPAAQSLVAAPPALSIERLQRIVEFAGVVQRADGARELRIAIGHGALAGAQLGIASFGRRRIGVRLRGGTTAVSEEDIRALVEQLRSRGLEVVELDVE